MEGSIEKYGSGTLFNPAHETPLDLFAVLPGLHRAYIIEGKINDKEYRPGQKYYLYAPMNLKGGIAWEFNLDQPISTQIDEARSELERAQKHKHGKLIPARKNASNPANREVVQFDNWRRFLRVLDASESGASDREILDVLWPGWRETGQKTFAHIASDRNAGEELKKSFPF